MVDIIILNMIMGNLIATLDGALAEHALSHIAAE
jgi:hypothetical protein